jgi:hypothetical protein
MKARSQCFDHLVDDFSQELDVGSGSFSTEQPALPPGPLEHEAATQQFYEEIKHFLN